MDRHHSTSPFVREWTTDRRHSHCVIINCHLRRAGGVPVVPCRGGDVDDGVKSTRFDTATRRGFTAIAFVAIVNLISTITRVCRLRHLATQRRTSERRVGLCIITNAWKCIKITLTNITLNIFIHHKW